MEEKANAVFIGGTGLGKTHLACALAHEACQQNRHVLFAPAVTIINTLAAAQATNTLGRAINTNRAYKDWAKTFANDTTLTAAVLDRVCHHCETVVVEGRSYRMKDRIEE